MAENFFSTNGDFSTINVKADGNKEVTVSSRRASDFSYMANGISQMRLGIDGKV